MSKDSLQKFTITFEVVPALVSEHGRDHNFENFVAMLESSIQEGIDGNEPLVTLHDLRILIHGKDED